MTPVALAVDDLRDQYLREMALVRQTCERTGDGTAAIRRRSAVVDRILIEMWRRAFAGQPAQNVSLLALGGYGRKDLFPYSDIDVLFTFADEKTEEQTKEAVRALIQGMWDIGLRASPTSRTLKEAARFDPDTWSSRWLRWIGDFWQVRFRSTSSSTRTYIQAWCSASGTPLPRS